MSLKLIRVGLAFVFLGWCAFQPVLAATGERSNQKAAVPGKLLKKFDHNGNGQLDPEERAAAQEARQKRQGQGGRKGQGGPRPGLDPERRQKLLAKFDADGDGKLSETERAAAKEAPAKRGVKAH